MIDIEKRADIVGAEKGERAGGPGLVSMLPQSAKWKGGEED